MFSHTSRIKRSLVLVAAVAAVAAPAASARPADVQHVPASSATSQPSRGAAADGARYAAMAAHREAIANEQWRAANPATVVEVSRPGQGGLDLLSAGLGASLVFALILVEVLARWGLRRRREARVRLA